MAAGTAAGYTFEMSGGRLCLDFANTVSNQRGEDPRERLTDYGALLAWSRQAGVVTDDEAAYLAGAAARRPKDAAAVLARAVALRQAIFHIFSAVAAGERPEAADLARLNAELVEVMSRSRIVPTATGFALECVDDTRALDRTLRPVTRSAADLLTSADLPNVRECASDACTWLFMDRTRNRSRRWCDMKSCGNRAKVRRHRARKRGEAGGRPSRA